MLRLCLAILLLLVTTRPVALAVEWQLVWSDEFEESGAPDVEKWGYEEGFVRGREAQYYVSDRRENARVENGKLIIEARNEKWQNPSFIEGSPSWKKSRESASYTSASLTTSGKASWKYGKIEVRAKLPRGRGVWPAIWMLGDSHKQVGWPRCGEIDIMEFVGYQPNMVHQNVHCAKYNHVKDNGKGTSIAIENLSDVFHVYAVQWYHDRLVFYVDDIEYLVYEDEGTGADAWPFDQPCYLLLNLAIGGKWGGQQGIDEAIFPQRYEVDYVRVYQKKLAQGQ